MLHIGLVDRRRSSIAVACLSVASVLSGTASAQCPAWKPTFASVQGANDAVHASAVYDDGTGAALYIGGAFTTAGGASANRIAKWDGTSWSPLDSGATGVNGLNDEVRALAVFDDGNGPALYAGGGFDMAGGAAASHIARWDGANWSALDTGVDDWVTALAVFDDGGGPALYAGGSFTVAGGASASRVARWNGQAWSPLGGGVDDTVFALQVFHAGTGSVLCAGGQFTTAGGASANRIAQWNGATWSPLGAGFTGDVHALTVFDGGSGAVLCAGGNFTVAQGSPGNHVAQWNGQAWSPIGSGTDGFVGALCAFDDGGGRALYAGGTFAHAGFVALRNVARWNGTTWSALAGGRIDGGGVNTLRAFDDGAGTALIVGGEFVEAGGFAAHRIARWKPGGSAHWSALPENSTGLTGDVNALAVFDNGGGNALYAAGSFTTAGPVVASRIARWNGTNWSALGAGLSEDAVAYALATAAVAGSGNALYVGGLFSGAGGVPASNVARWNGTSWSALGAGPPNTYALQTLAAFDDGQGVALFAGGLEAPLGQSTVELMRWNGASWSTLPALGATNGGIASIQTLLTFDDGHGPSLFVGGRFDVAASLHLGAIARWDGAQWKALANGTNGTVYALAIFDDGNGPALYIGGTFTSPGNNVARWNGTSWSALGNGVDGSVHALAVFDDGVGLALHAGGDFTNAGSGPASRLAKWDGSTWTPVSVGLDAEVSALQLFDDGTDGVADLYIGGAFQYAGGSLSPDIAELSSCSISAFCFGDGTANLCPCFNLGALRHGCDNSAATGGAILAASGSTHPDSIVFSIAGELPNAFSIFLQGDANQFPGVEFGDGILCAGGNLLRLYEKNAAGGMIVVPGPGDLSISARAAMLGDPLLPGSIRYYQTYYRDPNEAFCAPPIGDNWNTTNAVRIAW